MSLIPMFCNPEEMGSIVMDGCVKHVNINLFIEEIKKALFDDESVIGKFPRTVPNISNAIELYQFKALAAVNDEELEEIEIVADDSFTAGPWLFDINVVIGYSTSEKKYVFYINTYASFNFG